MKIRGFITHKLAEEQSDCQDYFNISKENKKIAISDGMSQSIFPLTWAQILVDHYLKTDDVELPKDISGLKKQWYDFVIAELERQEKEGLPTWMLQNCISERQGAGATFCGVKFSGKEWTGQVLGDSCLIEINAENKIETIHTSQTGDFGNHPDFLDSITDGRGEPKNIKGELRQGGKLLFVTDPFAEFLYLKKQQGMENDYVEQLLRISSQEEFVRLVDAWRENEKMHNDDSTLVIVEHDGNDNFIVEDDIVSSDEPEQGEEVIEEKKNVHKNGKKKSSNEKLKYPCRCLICPCFRELKKLLRPFRSNKKKKRR